MDAAPGGIWIGPAGTGKSRALRAVVARHQAAGGLPDRLLILVTNRDEAPAWHPHRVQTLVQWAQGEVALGWPWVETALPPGPAAAAPARLPTAVVAHLLARHAGASHRPGEPADLPLPPQRLGSLLARRLHRGAALAGLPEEALAGRLRLALGGDDAEGLAGAVAQAVQSVRAALAAGRLVDAGLAVELWRRQLLPNPDYRRLLRERWDGVVIDDLAEQPPVVLDLVAALRAEGVPVWLAYDPEGGHNPEQGHLDPEAAQSPALRGLPQHTLAPPAPTAPATTPPVRLTRLERRLRGDLLRAVADRVLSLIEAGTPPAEIAVLTPLADAGLATTLGRLLPPALAPLVPIPPVRPLDQEPGPRALLTMARLAGAAENAASENAASHEVILPPGADAVAQAVAFALGLDPLRARAVAAAYRQLGRLPDPPPDAPAAPEIPGAAGAPAAPAGPAAPAQPATSAVRAEPTGSEPVSTDPEDWLARHLGPAALHRYREWVAFLDQARSLPLSRFLHQAVTTWILPQPTAAQQLPACRRLVDLARTLESPSLTPLLGTPLLQELLAVAAQDYWAPPRTAVPPAGVWIGSPAAFLAQKRTVAVQIWLDARSWDWLSAPAHPLANPFPLRPTWPEEQVWTDAHHQEEQRRRSRQLVAGLLARCRAEVVLAASELDARGQEADGPLMDWVLAGWGRPYGEEEAHGRPQG